MKIRLIDVDGNSGQTDSFVTREPKEGEYLYSRNGRDILIVDIYQFVRNTKENQREEPDFVAMVEYQENGNPVLTDSYNEAELKVVDWLSLGDDDENL
ncbi:hypothetical protein A6F53_05165 [Levilactobacillus brevis]|uniref:hypothetical protein n=1 Tax=Levilactobacillus brevis TaxID=1580 RepID=UPI0007F907A9|nr:hypothetical protein [Levilactobacillus brevis]ANN48667.1 hypothetical protein A6F53_05165 [Levilactobacillus brevis]